MLKKRYMGLLAMLCWLGSGQAVAQIVNVQSLLNQKKQGLLLQVAGSADWRVGNVNFALFRGAMLMRFLHQKHTLLLSSQGGFGTKGEDRFVARAFGHLRYRYTFLPWLGVETYGQVEFNEFWRLATRGLGGVGFIAKWSPSRSFQVLLGTAYMFEFNRFSDPYVYPNEGADKVFHRWSNYLRLSFQPSRIFSVQNTTYIQPSFENFSDWRLLVDSSLLFRLNKWLWIKVSHVFAYRSVPPVGGTKKVEPFDSSLLVGLKSSILLWRPSHKRKKK